MEKERSTPGLAASGKQAEETPDGRGLRRMQNKEIGSSITPV
jgi:hypothetical protein